MRLGWATPFNKSAAIGRYSRFVVEELCARGHDVDIIRIEAGDALAAEPLDIEARIRIHGEVDLTSYDVLVVNFGNHAPYHAGALDMVVQRAPLGIFHDIEMRHFASELEQQRGLVMPMLAGYSFDSPPQGRDNLVDETARPLIAGLASMTCGAIVHGQHYRDLVADYCPGPVKVMPLAYPPPPRDPGARAGGRNRRVTIFGMIHDQKQPQRLMQALQLLQKEWWDVELHVAGVVDKSFEHELVSEARRLGTFAPVFHGYVPDDELQDLFEQSQVVCCLRYPVSEGSSASLITTLHAGRPLVVPDVASFALVPDDLVSKVSYSFDWRDVASAISEIFADPEKAEDRARRARDWAIGQYSADRYVDALEPMLEAVREYEPMIAEARRRGTSIWNSARDLEERFVLTHTRELSAMIKAAA